MDDKQFDKLLKKMRTVVREEVKEATKDIRDSMATKEDVSGIYNMLDSISDRLDTDEGERAAIISQVDRDSRRIDSLNDRVTKLEQAAV
ncbi:MAG: hypothetical protein LBH36_00570 [Candidatus Nomurabacteria bacterium]|jgi:TRAP-type C4-dicarboxylate transport system substrate-binding protein|nr:hypothetical protein [Candidatus Nomurabacteria bacterium]